MRIKPSQTTTNAEMIMTEPSHCTRYPMGSSRRHWSKKQLVISEVSPTPLSTSSRERVCACAGEPDRRVFQGDPCSANCWHLYRSLQMRGGHTSRCATGHQETVPGTWQLPRSKRANSRPVLWSLGLNRWALSSDSKRQCLYLRSVKEAGSDLSTLIYCSTNAFIFLRLSPQMASAFLYWRHFIEPKVENVWTQLPLLALCLKPWLPKEQHLAKGCPWEGAGLLAERGGRDDFPTPGGGWWLVLWATGRHLCLYSPRVGHRQDWGGPQMRSLPRGLPVIKDGQYLENCHTWNSKWVFWEARGYEAQILA